MYSSKKRILGISIGGTNACLGIEENGLVNIIPNDQGNRTTPCYVAFSGSDCLTGDRAKNQQPINISNTIYGIQAIAGLKFNDPEVQNLIKIWPFKVECGPDDDPLIVVQYNDAIAKFTPGELIAKIFSKLKEDAESYLVSDLADAEVVLAVLYHYTGPQREAIKESAKLAGLNVVAILDEFTAVSIAYEKIGKIVKGQKYIIFNFGGTSLSVAVVEEKDGVFEVLAESRDLKLGGSDFDMKLTHHLAAEFQTKHGVEILSNSKAMGRLKRFSESAKRILSTSMTAPVEIDSLAQGIDLYKLITRKKFEELCLPLFEDSIKHVENALTKAGVDKSEIKAVLLAGGSSRMPNIIKLLSNYFEGKEVHRIINQEEAAAYGAGIQAAKLRGESKLLSDIFSMEVVPLSLGVQVAGGVMATVVPRFTTIPGKKAQIFTTSVDCQTNVEIQIFEGERARTKDNIFLGSLVLDGIESGPKGEAKIKITFEINIGYKLTVSAVNLANNKENRVSIGIKPERYSLETIKKNVTEAEINKKVDEEIRSANDSNNALESAN